MFQFLILLVVIFFIYSWTKTLPPAPKPKRTKNRHYGRRNRRKQHYIEEDNSDDFEYDDWRSDMAYSDTPGNYYHID